MGLIDAFSSLFSDNTNKVKETTGVLDQLPELALDTPDEDLIALSDLWEKRYQPYEAEVKKRQDRNKDYWKGKHFANKQNDKAQVDNLIFEALETFLPLATKKNPEPFVRGDNSEEGQALAKNVQVMLTFHADRLRMKLRLKRTTRDWALKLIGVQKHGWDETQNDITSEVIRPENIIFDPDGTINDDMEYTGKYIGEKMSDTASNLIARFPNQTKYITKKVDKKIGTVVNYTEWWSCNPAEYVFWKLDKLILGKTKNPHWNYENPQTVTDQYAAQTVQMVPGKNHFNAPKAPYTFLGGVYNTGDHPHDETSLIEQAIPNQDLVNKRQMQIDKNADSMNGGVVVSQERSGLTNDQATEVTEALRAGGTVVIPRGAANEAIYRDQAPSLPGDIYQQLSDTREELRNIFGTRGSTPSGTINEQTATGKTLVREQDSDRIGGGVTEYLEQFADAQFNWWVQLMMVYYDEPHAASVIGKERAMEYVSLKGSDLVSKLTVSVKEGSLIPDSDTDRANEAVELAKMNDIDPISLFDRLGFSDPKQAAERLYMWRADPSMLFPEIGAQIQEKQDAQMAQQAQQIAVKK